MMCIMILAAILDCEELEVKDLEEKIKYWKLDIDEITENLRDYAGMPISYENLIQSMYKKHIVDVKNYIITLLEENKIAFGKDIFQYYEPEIYINFVNSKISDKYKFWGYNIEGLKYMLSEIVEFLINEGIVKGEVKTTLLDKLTYK